MPKRPSRPKKHRRGKPAKHTTRTTKRRAGRVKKVRSPRGPLPTARKPGRPALKLPVAQEPKRILKEPKGDAAKLAQGYLPDSVVHVAPKLGKTYGRRFGAKKIVRFSVEDGVALVHYINGHGNGQVLEQESLLMFNRWALRRGILVP